MTDLQSSRSILGRSNDRSELNARLNTVIFHSRCIPGSRVAVYLAIPSKSKYSIFRAVLDGMTVTRNMTQSY